MEDSFTGSQAEISFVNGVVVNYYVLMKGPRTSQLAESNPMNLESGPFLWNGRIFSPNFRTVPVVSSMFPDTSSTHHPI
jgi:hypothetical protein